ncbi:endonuclease domain-containing protein [Streptomyces sp. NBC_01232]|uniref:endonuclease domain-containing protein n=1 Tax=Streptomyces sp. NBC_01232 TaxID=2903786 RepID=UPI003FA3D81E
MYTWLVRAAGPERNPAEVNRQDRCPFGGASWPPTPARTRSIRILREALIAAYGPDCQLCGLYPGEMVDHDHETGYVRGMLCRFCNCTLEECPPHRRLPQGGLHEQPASGRPGPHLPSEPGVAAQGIHPPAKNRDARLRPVRRSTPPGPPRRQLTLNVSAPDPETGEQNGSTHHAEPRR